MSRQSSDQSLNNRACPPDKDGDSDARPTGPDRLAREAEALRANLRRRKAQARARRDAAADPARPPESQAGGDRPCRPEGRTDQPGGPGAGPEGDPGGPDAGPEGDPGGSPSGTGG
jgi:hypothetical protein